MAEALMGCLLITVHRKIMREAEMRKRSIQKGKAV